MSRETDHSDHPDPLPSPELNPLLNPLLSQNMGRWAEVYFTTAPEKRQQAVLELLRELEAAAPVTASQPGPAVCPSCGHQNAAQQNFCGACGRQLRVEVDAPSTRTEHRTEPGPTPQEWNRPFQLLPLDSPNALSSPLQAASHREPELGHETRVALGRRIQKAVFSPAFSRLYLAGALILVIVTLAFMVWRSSQVVSGLSRSPAVNDNRQLAPAVTGQEAARTAPQPTEWPSLNPAPQSAPSAQPAATATPVHLATPQPGPAGQPNAAAAPPAQVSAGSGSEELAVAQSLLKGTAGHERNSAAAISWLWKAVAKRNTEATLLLSDLYLNGDGVPKSCDQARILLDTAARKGSKAAADRLRQLPVMGCE